MLESSSLRRCSIETLNDYFATTFVTFYPLLITETKDYNELCHIYSLNFGNDTIT
jgi:hypothetical protein